MHALIASKLIPRCDLYFDIAIIHLEQFYEKDDKASIVGASSYKEHGFRMLTIWASGLNPDVPLARELCDALSAVDKKTIAGNPVFISSINFAAIKINDKIVHL